MASPTSSHAPLVDCCTFIQATDRVDGCDLDSSLEDGTCSPPIISSEDFNDDGRSDVIARGCDGALWMCPGGGIGGFWQPKARAQGAIPSLPSCPHDPGEVL
jgi:hypothetical protein